MAKKSQRSTLNLTHWCGSLLRLVGHFA